MPFALKEQINNMKIFTTHTATTTTTAYTHTNTQHTTYTHLLQQ